MSKHLHPKEHLPHPHIADRLAKWWHEIAGPHWLDPIVPDGHDWNGWHWAPERAPWEDEH